MENAYRVILFGEKVFFGDVENIIIDNVEISYHAYPSEGLPKERLANFDFIIMDYEAFSNSGYTYKEHQDLIEKQLIEALDKGKTVIFLHYDVSVPKYDQYAYSTGNMNQNSIDLLESSQIGFRFLRYFKICPLKIDNPIHMPEVNRSEFKVYRDKWGSSKNFFHPYDGERFQDIILLIDDRITRSSGFSLDFRTGHLIYLPCQRNFARSTDIEEMYCTLINALITYHTKTAGQLPDWLYEPLFNKEKKCVEELEDEKTKVKKLEEKLLPYNNAKILLTSREYNLENAAIKFFQENLGINIFRDEKYNEDFWLLNNNKEKIAICEIKSFMKGFKKTGIYDLYKHKDQADLDESFPAILIVNQNLQANSMKQKTGDILPQDVQVAVNHNILIVRVEDLLYMWDSLQENKITKEQAIELLISNIGWLCFKSDGSYKVHK